MSEKILNLPSIAPENISKWYGVLWTELERAFQQKSDANCEKHEYAFCYRMAQISKTMPVLFNEMIQKEGLSKAETFIVLALKHTDDPVIIESCWKGVCERFEYMADYVDRFILKKGEAPKCSKNKSPLQPQPLPM